MDKKNILIVGAGYVGSSCAVAFGNKNAVTIFDIDSKKIESFKKNQKLLSSDLNKNETLIHHIKMGDKLIHIADKYNDPDSLIIRDDLTNIENELNTFRLQNFNDFGSHITDLDTDSEGSIYLTGYSRKEFDGQKNNGGVDTFITKFSMRENGKFFENRSSDSIIGKLSTVDQSNNANYVYQLVNGSGDVLRECCFSGLAGSSLQAHAKR